jgi:ribosomal protein S18 acetylase RimI-like enzyme
VSVAKTDAVWCFKVIDMTYSERNLMVFFQLLAASANVKILKTPNYSCLQVPNSTYPSVLFLPNFNALNAPRILEQIRESSLPQVIRTSPILTNEITIQALKENTAYQRFWTAMSMDLDKLKPFERDNKLEIRLITERSDIKDWCEIVGIELMGGAIEDSLFYKMSQNSSCRFYLAFENNIPVATALTIITGDEVGVYLIATSKEYRKKGIGQQITTQSLLEAQQLGCLSAHLEATDLGKSVYEKIGFLKMADIAVFRI